MLILTHSLEVQSILTGTARQRREGSGLGGRVRWMLVLSSLPTLNPSWGPSLWDDAIHIQGWWIIPPQLELSESTLTDAPRGVFPW